MATLTNDQYNKFILQHIIRPYQITLGIGDKAIESLTYVSKNKTPICYYYGDLLRAIFENKKWFNLVIDRLSRCYSSIDFSFFRDDNIAALIKIALIEKGVRPIMIKYDLQPS